MSLSSPQLKASGRAFANRPSRTLSSLPLYRDESGSSSSSASGDRLLPGWRRTNLIRLLALLAIGGTLLVSLLPSSSSSAVPQTPWIGWRTHAAKDADPDSYDIPADHRNSFESTDEATDAPGWSRFVLEPDTGAHYVRPPPTQSQRELSAACAERWIADGVLCEEVKGAAGRLSAGVLDVVQTFVNGSDVRHRAWRAALSVGNEPVEPDQHGARFVVSGRGSKENHVREHDELRHSMRSTFQNLPHAAIRRFVLITSDLPEPAADSDNTRRPGTPVHRRGQIPTWLDLDAVHASAGSALVPPIVLRHDSSLFRAPSGDLTQEQRDEWHRQATPTYNSNALEAQLANLDTPDAIFYLCDDMFLFRPFQISDIHTPFYGTVMRMLLVNGQPKGTADSDPEGEWGTLRYSAWLLDERFGKRQRAYVAHVAKPFTGAAIREVAANWPQDLSDSSLVRFRGRGPTLNQPFLLSHYVIEAHRQALLWSLMLARFDADRSGTYSQAERLEMIRFLLDASLNTIDDFADASAALDFSIRWPDRETHDGNRELAVMGEGGFEIPSATKYMFSSNDGYASLLLPDTPKGGWPRYDSARPQGTEAQPACSFSVEHCFGPSFLEHGGDNGVDGETDAFAVFRRAAFARPECGDCLIVAGLRNSGALGLSAFLPPADVVRRSEPTAGPIAPLLAVGSIKFGHADFTWRTIEDQLPAFVDLRDFCVRLISRYAYTLGESPGRFIMVNRQEPEELEATLDHVVEQTSDWASDALYRFRAPAFGGLNDDMPEREGLPEMDAVIRRFVARVWPTPCWWERGGS